MLIAAIKLETSFWPWLRARLRVAQLLSNRISMFQLHANDAMMLQLMQQMNKHYDFQQADRDQISI